MTSKQKIQKNYTNTSSKNQLTLSIHIDQWIPYDDSVRLLSLLLDELDDTVLRQAYSPYGRKSVVPPNILFKLIVYGFMNQIYSSRGLEKGLFRYFGEKPFLGIEYFNAKKFKTSSSIHLTFNHFNSVDISLTNGISVWIN